MKLKDWEIRQSIGAKVIPGQVAVSSAFVTFANDSLIIVEIDCRSKYPEIGGYSSHVLYLDASEHTLNKVNSDNGTMIEFTLPQGFEIGSARTGRYNVTVFFHRPEECHNPTVIWESP